MLYLHNVTSHDSTVPALVDVLPAHEQVHDHAKKNMSTDLFWDLIALGIQDLVALMRGVGGDATHHTTPVRAAALGRPVSTAVSSSSVCARGRYFTMKKTHGTKPRIILARSR